MSRPQEEKIARWYFGGVASAMAACFTHPIDLVKVHIQTQQEGKITFLGAFLDVVKRNGLFALWGGLTASLLRQFTYSTTRFGIYEVCSRSHHPETFPKKILLAGFGGAVGGLVGAPADLINVRMQNDVKLSEKYRRNYKNAMEGIKRCVGEDGVLSLWAGSAPLVIRSVVMNIGQIAVYEQAKYLFISTGYFKDDLITHLTASLSAGIIATTITQPLDVIKTRSMNARPGEFKNTLHIIRYTAKIGPLGFYKGYMPALMRLAPHTTLVFIFLEQLRMNFGYYK